MKDKSRIIQTVKNPKKENSADLVRLILRPLKCSQGVLSEVLGRLLRGGLRGHLRRHLGGSK